jgi:hypothetical protein
MSARENKTVRPCEDLREKAPTDPSNDLASDDKDDKAIVERHDPSDGTDPMTVEEVVEKCGVNKSKNNWRPASTTFVACTLYLHAVRGGCEESTSAVGREGGGGEGEGAVEGDELPGSGVSGGGVGGGGGEGSGGRSRGRDDDGGETGDAPPAKRARGDVEEGAGGGEANTEGGEGGEQGGGMDVVSGEDGEERLEGKDGQGEGRGGGGGGGGERGVKDSHPCDNVLLFFKFYDPTVEDVEERVKLVHVQVRELHERATLTYVHIQFSETSYVHSIMKFFTRPAEIHRAEI